MSSVRIVFLLKLKLLQYLFKLGKKIFKNNNCNRKLIYSTSNKSIKNSTSSYLRYCTNCKVVKNYWKWIIFVCWLNDVEKLIVGKQTFQQNLFRLKHSDVY